MRIRLSKEKLEKLKQRLNKNPILLKFEDEQGNLFETWNVSYNIECEMVEINGINDETMISDGQIRKRNSNEMDNDEEISSEEKVEPENIRKRQKLTKEEKKREKLQELIKELENPLKTVKIVDEDAKETSGIEEIIKRYNRVDTTNGRDIRDWYELGRRFKQEIESRKYMSKTKTRNEQTVRQELYKEIVEYITEYTQEEIRDVNRFKGKVRKRFQNAENVYELFLKIGNDRIERIKRTTVTFVVELTEGERQSIIDHFKERRVKRINKNTMNKMINKSYKKHKNGIRSVKSKCLIEKNSCVNTAKN